jgi:hypothetical protein
MVFSLVRLRPIFVWFGCDLGGIPVNGQAGRSLRIEQLPGVVAEDRIAASGQALLALDGGPPSSDGMVRLASGERAGAIPRERKML